MKTIIRGVSLVLLVVTADMPAANRNTLSTSEALDRNYGRIVTAHNARVYSARHFERSVESFRDFNCPGDRPLCSRDI